MATKQASNSSVINSSTANVFRPRVRPIIRPRENAQSTYTSKLKKFARGMALPSQTKTR